MDPAVEHIIDPRDRPVGAGTVRRLLPHRTRRMVGPFIFADIIGPEDLQPGLGINVDAHPHIGLSTVTYLFDGRMVHRDSTGAVQTIEPGAVNWMTAGSGVTHTERSHPDDLAITRPMYGLQTWVALPTEAQDISPSFQHAPAADIPADTTGGSTVRVAVGTGWSLESPVTPSSPLVLAEVTLADGSPVPVAVDALERAIIALDGAISINDHRVTNGQLVVLQPGAPAQISGSGTAMVLGGDPVGRRHIWWNFVHSDLDRIEAAKADWLDQHFPTVPGDHLPYVPLPQ